MLVKNFDDLKLDFETDIELSEYWTDSEEKSCKFHNIHWYPAKFPPHLVQRAFDYAKEIGIDVHRVGDCFTGSGTTALECRMYGYDFWGCDINPTAILISKVKTYDLDIEQLKFYFDDICRLYATKKGRKNIRVVDKERIDYWYEEKQKNDLNVLLYCIYKSVPEGEYQDFMLCVFSDILRGCSKWLAKSIKPQVDPFKEIKPVFESFFNKFNRTLIMYRDLQKSNPANIKAEFVTGNYTKIEVPENYVDLLITSPPYVTSYEYTDLHQLSTLWLDFAYDYRDLRYGSIGSSYNTFYNPGSYEELNETGKSIIDEIIKRAPKREKATIRYFCDISKSIQQNYRMLRKGGIMFYVIGNTKFLGAKVDNAKYTADCMLNAGFKEIEVFKRQVSNKFLTCYRDGQGKFTNDKLARKVYSVEFVIVARK